MKRLIKLIIGISVGFLMSTNIVLAQQQLGAVKVNGNFEVTGTFTFGSGTTTLMVSGDSLATVEFLRTLFEPLITFSDTAVVIKDQNNNVTEGELVEVTESSSSLLLTPSSDIPSLVDNTYGFWQDSDDSKEYVILNRNGTQTGVELNVDMTP